MVGGEEKGQGGERENTGVEVMAAVVVVGKVGVGVVVVVVGWGGYTLNTTGYYHGGPSLIHIPLIPVGNLLDRHT